MNIGSENNSHLWTTLAQRPSEAYLLASVEQKQHCVATNITLEFSG